MSSSVNPIVNFEKWNRKLHYYLGLYFLFFLWLFSLTGLILNHGSWAMAMGGNDRREMKYERSIRPPLGTNHLERARHQCPPGWPCGVTGSAGGFSPPPLRNASSSIC